MARYFILSAMLAVSGALPASAQQQGLPIDTSRAQVEMEQRVAAAVKRYADEIGMSDSWIAYCYQELYLHTYQHPANGQIPFGFNYSKVTDQQRLDLVLSIREN